MKKSILFAPWLFVLGMTPAFAEIPRKEDVQYVEESLAKLVSENFQALTDEQEMRFQASIQERLEQLPTRLDRALIDRFLSAFRELIKHDGGRRKYCDEDFAILIAYLRHYIGFFVERFTMTEEQRELVKNQARELIRRSEPGLRELLKGFDAEPFARFLHEITRTEGPVDVNRNPLQIALEDNKRDPCNYIEALDNPSQPGWIASCAFSSFLRRPLTEEEMKAIMAEWDRRIAELEPFKKRIPEWKEKLEKIFKEETDPKVRWKKLDAFSIAGRPGSEEFENGMYHFMDELVPTICAVADTAVPPPPSAEVKAALEAAEEVQRKREEEQRNKKDK
ncbi:MAG: hypothetical protein RDV41_06530 [Planctomycetota bacterium]|nr:hypothetical protein [Planctomycetota bacterium]